LPHVPLLAAMGYKIYATAGTAKFLTEKLEKKANIVITPIRHALEKEQPNATTLISERTVRLVINVPSSRDSRGTTAGFLLRRKAVDGGAALLFDLRGAMMLVDALYEKFQVEQKGGEFWSLDSWQECHRIG